MRRIYHLLMSALIVFRKGSKKIENQYDNRWGITRSWQTITWFYIQTVVYSTGLRSWLKTATGGKTSVPQIFFNKQYVGGNRELQDIISAADQEKWSSLLQEVKQLFQSKSV